MADDSKSNMEKAVEAGRADPIRLVPKPYPRGRFKESAGIPIEKDLKYKVMTQNEGVEYTYYDVKIIEEEDGLYYDLDSSTFVTARYL